MGFLDKMKNLFTEEEEIIEPVTKEVMQVEIKAPAPKKETVEPELIEEMMKPVETKPAPVFFDDKDFASLEKPKPKQKPKNTAPLRVERNAYGNKERVKERHSFRPSPIISPVYGILDKNYKKDDIVQKKDESLFYTSSKEMTVDEVRQKAFGTLEDDIDLNLNTDEMISDDVILGNTLENDIFEEMETTNINEPIVKEDNDFDEVTLGNVENFDLEDELEENDLVEDELNNEEEQIDESDLFNLIDSMYEKRDEN